MAGWMNAWLNRLVDRDGRSGGGIDGLIVGLVN